MIREIVFNISRNLHGMNTFLSSKSKDFSLSFNYKLKFKMSKLFNSYKLHGCDTLTSKQYIQIEK